MLELAHLSGGWPVGSVTDREAREDETQAWRGIRMGQEEPDSSAEPADGETSLSERPAVDEAMRRRGGWLRETRAPTGERPAGPPPPPEDE
jgi:hypothetical protein